MNIPYKHISYLKTLPQHGRVDPDPLDNLRNLDINNINNAAEAFKQLTGAIQEVTNGGEKLTTSFKKLTSGAANLQNGIASLIGTQQKLGKLSLGLVNQLTKLENTFAGLNKTYGLNRKSAGDVAQGFIEIANARGTDVGKIQKYAKALKDFAPLQTFNLAQNNKNTQALFGVADALSKQLGMSDEATAGYLRYNAVTDAAGESALKTSQEIANAFAGGNIEQASMFMKQIGEDIGKAGSAARIQYGRVAGSLEQAVLKSRQLGISLADVNSTGQTMLDIESSVGKELEYQLLTGNRLVDQDGKSLTAKMRQATITGNANEQAEVMQQIMKQEGDTLRTNLFARQQMADLMGISEEKLAGMLEKEKFISKYGLDEKTVNLNADDLRDKIQGQLDAEQKTINAMAEGTAEEKKAKKDAQAAFDKSQTELNDANLDTRTTAEQALDENKKIQTNTLATAIAAKESKLFADAVEKAKKDPTLPTPTKDQFKGTGLSSIFEETAKEVKSIIEPIEEVAGALDQIAANTETTQKFGQLDTIATGISKLGPIVKNLTSVFGDKFSGVVGKLTDGANKLAEGILTLTAYDPTQLGGDDGTKVDKIDGEDVFSPAGSSTRTLTLNKGSLNAQEISLNNNDTVMAGTNLFDPPTNNANNNMFAAQREAIANLLGNNTQNTQPVIDPINYEKLAAAMSKISISIDPMYGASSMNNQTFQT